MYISLENKTKYTDDFLEWVIRYIQLVGFQELDRNRGHLGQVDKILPLYFPGIRQTKSYQLIWSGLKNLVFNRSANQITISINKAVKVPLNIDFLLSTVCQLIDQGNVEIKPLHLFSNLFSYVENNIDDLYSKYSFGVMI